MPMDESIKTPCEEPQELLNRQHPNRPVMQSENLRPFAVLGDVDERYGKADAFDPLPVTGRLRLLAHFASLPPTRDVLITLHEQTELALIALRQSEGRRELLLDQLQICETTIRWLLGEAKKQPRLAGKFVNAAMAVQSNLARIIVLLDQTQGAQLGEKISTLNCIAGDESEGDQ